MSKYSIKVQNSSGDDANIAIYQAYPTMDGLSLVWLLNRANEGNLTQFDWDVNWALNWGTTPTALKPGVQWSSSGKAQNMSPTEAGGVNAMGLKFSNEQFRTEPIAFYNKELNLGDMQVKTDDSFTVKQAKNMSIAVCMNGIPAFAMKGKPSGTYTFNTHPTYYICTTDHKKGVAVDGTFVSNPTEIVFSAGVTELSYVLNDKLKFVADK